MVQTLFLVNLGYARDGGLYFPEEIPSLSKDEIEKLSELSYPELVKKIIPLFISEDELPQSALNQIIDKAFMKFSGRFWCTYPRMR